MAAAMRELMWDKVGLVRTAASLDAARDRLQAMQRELAAAPAGSAGGFDLSLLGWYDLRDSLLAAEAVTLAAQNRTESRGAHVREDFPAVDPKFEQNQAIGLGSAGLAAAWEPVTRQ